MLPGTSACATDALSSPTRSTWPAPLCSNRATENQLTYYWYHCFLIIGLLNSPSQTTAYPSAEDLVDGGRLLERALGNDLGPHLLHVEHESVQRLLDVVHLVLLRTRLLRPTSAANSGGDRRPLLSNREAHHAVVARHARAEVGAGGVRPAATVDSARR